MCRTSCHAVVAGDKECPGFHVFLKICAEEGRVSCKFGPDGPSLESDPPRWDWDPAELELGTVTLSC